MERIIGVYEKNASSKMIKRPDYLERNKHRVKLKKKERDKKEEWINVTSTPSCAAPYRRHVNSVSGDRVAH